MCVQNKRGDKTCGKPGSHEKKSSCVTGETGQAESTNCRSESWPEGARTKEPFRLRVGGRGSGPAPCGRLEGSFSSVEIARWGPNILIYGTIIY